MNKNNLFFYSFLMLGTCYNLYSSSDELIPLDVLTAQIKELTNNPTTPALDAWSKKMDLLKKYLFSQSIDLKAPIRIQRTQFFIDSFMNTAAQECANLRPTGLHRQKMRQILSFLDRQIKDLSTSSLSTEFMALSASIEALWKTSQVTSNSRTPLAQPVAIKAISNQNIEPSSKPSVTPSGHLFSTEI